MKTVPPAARIRTEADEAMRAGTWQCFVSVNRDEKLQVLLFYVMGLPYLAGNIYAPPDKLRSHIY